LEYLGFAMGTLITRAARVVVLTLLAAAGLSACGDPLIVLGDLPGFMRIVAGIPGSGGDQADSMAIASRLRQPVSLATLDDGTLVVADATRRIVSVSPAGRLTVLYRGPDCFDRTCLTAPQGTAVQGDALLIADNGSDHIWRFDLKSRALAKLAGTGEHGTAADGTPAAHAPLASPTDCLVLPDGQIVFAERAAHRIRVIATDGRLQTLAGTGVAGFHGDGGQARAAQLNGPTGLALRGDQLFFTDHGNHVVRVVDLASGVIRTIAGTGAAGFSGDHGPALSAKLDLPWSLDRSADGATLFVSEIGNHRVRALDLLTGKISTFAGTGAREYSGNGRAAGQTSLDSPFGIAASRHGFLFIADTHHHIVWRTLLN
jgi:glucose/arabinose dehydrogenase